MVIFSRLTMDTFWSTATTAVILTEGQPELLKICAEFAGNFNRLINVGFIHQIVFDFQMLYLQLFNSDKPRDDKTVHIVMNKMAALKKAK